MSIYEKLFGKKPLPFVPESTKGELGGAHRILRGHYARVTAVGFDAEARVALTGDTEGNVASWKAPDFEPHQKLQHMPPAPITAFASGPEGIYFARGRCVKTWKAGFEVAPISKIDPLSLDHGHSRDIVTILRTGRDLISADQDGRLVFRNIRSAKQDVGSLRHPIVSLACTSEVLYDPDATGGQLAVGLTDGRVAFIDLDTRNMVGMLNAHTREVRALSFQNTLFQQRKILATTCPNDGCVRVAERGTAIAELKVRSRVVAFSPDGRLLAHADRNEIVIRDALAWTEVARLRGHQGPVGALAFSPLAHERDLWNGWLLSGSHDGTARVWKVEA